MSVLVECVPNFSEGRDRAKVDRIASVIGSAARVLDINLDADHNRSVITFAGSPDAALEAAVLAAGAAAQLIDLGRHSGVHPRVGALDVLPFVPLRGLDLQDCARLAVLAGERISRTLHIPIYLYGAAARTPGRAKLSAIRKPDPGPPDIGGPAPHPTAGAIAAGARGFLIAYNINLDSANLAAARSIAHAVRASGGGLPGVQALGLSLSTRGIVQVSMNVTDFERSPLHTVFQAVSAGAARAGIRVLESELVGLLPRRALDLSAGFDLRWRADPSQSVLEDKLAAIELK